MKKILHWLGPSSPLGSASAFLCVAIAAIAVLILLPPIAWLFRMWSYWWLG
jgi:hypothetical protein